MHNIKLFDLKPKLSTSNRYVARKATSVRLWSVACETAESRRARDTGRGDLPLAFGIFAKLVNSGVLVIDLISSNFPFHAAVQSFSAKLFLSDSEGRIVTKIKKVNKVPNER